MDLTSIPPELGRYIEAIRDFDRFYEIRLQELRARFAPQMESTWSEMRVFRFMGGRHFPSPSGWIAEKLRMDASQVSRILVKWRAMGLVTVRRGGHDRRKREYDLSAWGRRAFRDMEELHRDEIRRLLQHQHPRQQRRLVLAMQAIQFLLTRSPFDVMLDFQSPAVRRRVRRSALRRVAP